MPSYSVYLAVWFLWLTPLVSWWIVLMGTSGCPLAHDALIPAGADSSFTLLRCNHSADSSGTDLLSLTVTSSRFKQFWLFIPVMKRKTRLPFHYSTDPSAHQHQPSRAGVDRRSKTERPLPWVAPATGFLCTPPRGYLSTTGGLALSERKIDRHPRMWALMF